MGTPSVKQNTPAGLVMAIVAISVLVLLAFVILLPGHAQLPKLNNYQPIKGAFGFNLGDTLPATYETETNDDRYGLGIIYNFPAPAELGLNTDNPTPCYLMLTDDRRIAEIDVMSNETERFSLANLKKVLEDKYGPGKYESKPDNSESSFCISQGDNSITLNRSVSGTHTLIMLCYRDFKLFDLTYDEQKKRQARIKELQIQHQDEIQRQMQKSLNDKL